MNWHLTGWRTWSLADPTGRIYATVRDSAGPAYAYVDGKGCIGEYLNVEYAKVAAEKACVAAPGRTEP